MNDPMDTFADASLTHLMDAFTEFLIARSFLPGTRLHRVDRWTHYIVTRKFAGFPKDIAGIIAGYVEIKMRLLDWIPREKLDPDTIYANPAAYRAGFLDLSSVPSDSNQIRTLEFAKNPEAIGMIESSGDKFVYNVTWSNPAVTEWAITRLGVAAISWFHFTANSSPAAVKLMLINLNHIKTLKYINRLSRNPGMIAWVRANPELIDSTFICANSAAIDIIQGLSKISYMLLAANPHPWAIEQMRLHQEKINWVMFSRNPGIFEEYVDPELVAAISE
jgi:hypothetical protein